MKNNLKKAKNERGSLALEHILFIGAVILAGVGARAFFQNAGDFMNNTTFAAAPTAVGN